MEIDNLLGRRITLNNSDLISLHFTEYATEKKNGVVENCGFRLVPIKTSFKPGYRIKIASKILKELDINACGKFRFLVVNVEVDGRDNGKLRFNANGHGIKIIANNVLFMPELDCNILKGSILDKRSCTIEFLIRNELQYIVQVF